MSLFRTKKTKVMLIIFGLFIQQHTNPVLNKDSHQNIVYKMFFIRLKLL